MACQNKRKQASRRSKDVASGVKSSEDSVGSRQEEFLATVDPRDDDDNDSIAKGGVPVPFPWLLHLMLEAAEKEGMEDVVCWQPHGRAFMVRKPNIFVEEIMPRFFGQTKYASFQRQLNLYGFSRFAHGVDKGAYYHDCFIRGTRSLVRSMVRRKIKGTKVRRTLSAHEEPNFYDGPWSLPPAKNNKNDSSDSECSIASAEERPKREQPTKTEEESKHNIPFPIKSITAEKVAHSASVSILESLTVDDVALQDSTLHDGDLLFFEGIPFHFIDSIEQEGDFNKFGLTGDIGVVLDTLLPV